jgi:glucose/arabinose dehydrogenase/cytochrome c553
MKNKVQQTTLQILLLLAASLLASPTLAQLGGVAESIELYQTNCAVCHGENMEGAAQGVPLLGELRHGDDMAAINASIRNGYADTGMPTWRDTLSESAIRNISLFILESRDNIDYVTFNYDTPLEIPNEVFVSELHNFRLETVVADLDQQPFSIAPLPDGSILLTEKMLGLSIISPEGVQSPLITGTPEVFDETYKPVFEQEWGLGWLFDVLPHPNYEDNGWVYLYYTERCTDCNTLSREQNSPVSLNKLVRGRIEDGSWVDQQVIWEADKEFYGSSTDVAAGGRLTFDDSGHVFFSLGAKGSAIFAGIQDLATPYGKIHRINDDGSIPQDNPGSVQEGIYPSMWTWGHRSPQGLEFDMQTGQLWGTEHGPRGGDEVNLLLRGSNYGWPLTSLGMNYDGTPVDYGPQLGIAFEMPDIQQPIVDLTPSPAVSSFIISDSEQFPEWHRNFLVGSLKARSLFRVKIDDNNRMVQRETLFAGLARIRDIEQDLNGNIFLLLEHNSGSRIVRLAPAE